jgi:hypothetical protein
LYLDLHSDPAFAPPTLPDTASGQTIRSRQFADLDQIDPNRATILKNTAGAVMPDKGTPDYQGFN